MLRHDLRGALRIVILEAVADTVRHDLTDGRVASGLLLRDRPHNDIPVSDHADQAIILSDWKRTEIIGPHASRRVANGHIGISKAYRWCHDFTDLHGKSPELSLIACHA